MEVMEVLVEVLVVVEGLVDLVEAMEGYFEDTGIPRACLAVVATPQPTARRPNCQGSSAG